VPLHELQPPREQGTWIVVVSVPFHPVALRHWASLRRAHQANRVQAVERPE
jgi:hypothetical protein